MKFISYTVIVLLWAGILFIATSGVRLEAFTDADDKLEGVENYTTTKTEAAPSSRLVFGDYDGILDWSSGELKFTGNMDASAKKFFELLKPMIDQYLAQKPADCSDLTVTEERPKAKPKASDKGKRAW